MKFMNIFTTDVTTNLLVTLPSMFYLIVLTKKGIQKKNWYKYFVRYFQVLITLLMLFMLFVISTSKQCQWPPYVLAVVLLNLIVNIMFLNHTFQKYEKKLSKTNQGVFYVSFFLMIITATWVNWNNLIGLTTSLRNQKSV